MKSSFILYTEYREKLKNLTYEQLGKLTSMIFAYEDEGSVETSDDPMVNIVFDIIKVDLDRADARYEETVEKRRNAGRNGGLKKAENASKDNQDVANLANASKPSKCYQMLANDSKSSKAYLYEAEADAEADKEEKKKVKKKSTNEELQTMVDESELTESVKASAKEWLVYKKQRKENYTQIGWQKQLTQLVKATQEYGESAVIDVINRCMASNYKGIIYDMLKNHKLVPKPNSFNQYQRSGTDYNALLDSIRAN